MSQIGYIVRPEYLDLAQQLAPPERVGRLDPLFDSVSELNELELSFPSRLASAREAAGHRPTKPSQAAREMARASVDADREYHRLLRRRCRRAASDVDVIQELWESARADPENASFLVEGAPDAIGAELASELLDRKRAVVASLREYLAEAGVSNTGDT